MVPDEPSLRELNRATVTRQLLAERSPLGVVEAVEALIGVQAQVPSTPLPGLRARIEDAEDLAARLETREILRAPLMRSTMHLFSARDFKRFRRTLQPALERAVRGFFGERARRLDFDRLEADTREILSEHEIMAPKELREALAERHPEEDPAALAYTSRSVTPIAQDASGRYFLVDVDEDLHTPELIRRYLQAFGPGTVKDFQAWAAAPG